MGIRITSNSVAHTVRRHLFNTTTEYRKSMAKLGSGLRINTAADDSAGLAVSEGLKKNIRALDKAVSNAADGISLVQTAEGFLDEVSTILARMNELAMQSRNGTVTDTDRGFLSKEFYSLRSEIDRIGWGAEFNDVKLLDGSGGTVSIQIGTGTGSDDRIDVDLSHDIDSNAIPLTAGIWDQGLAATAMAELDLAIRYISTLRSNFGSVQNRLESAVRSIRNTSENMTAANSRIRDLDVADETSTMSSLQVLQSAGVSVLAQANVSPEMALNLITGQ